MKPQIAYTAHWALPVLVDDGGKVFYIVPNTSLKLPFEPTEIFNLMDVVNLNEAINKLRLAEMKIIVLSKKVETGYDPNYLEKYFKEKQMNTPDIEMVNRILCKHRDFLREVLGGDSEWRKRNEVIRVSDKSHIDKDADRIQLFMDYLKA